VLAAIYDALARHHAVTAWHVDALAKTKAGAAHSAAQPQHQHQQQPSEPSSLLWAHGSSGGNLPAVDLVAADARSDGRTVVTGLTGAEAGEKDAGQTISISVDATGAKSPSTGDVRETFSVQVWANHDARSELRNLTHTHVLKLALSFKASWFRCPESPCFEQPRVTCQRCDHALACHEPTSVRLAIPGACGDVRACLDKQQLASGHAAM
jgi:hypothetical protein